MAGPCRQGAGWALTPRPAPAPRSSECSARAPGFCTSTRASLLQKRGWEGVGAACGPAAFPSQSAEAARCCCVFWASGAQKRRRWQEVVPTEAEVSQEGEQEALPPLLRHL